MIPPLSKSGLISACVFVNSALFGQNSAETLVEFTSSFKAGETLVYQLAETRYQQNPQGHYLFMQHDTSYYVFNVTDVKDSFIMLDFNFAESYIDNQIIHNNFNVHNPLKTETYKLLLDNRGNFVELTNWEKFRTILTSNLISSYQSGQIDSMTLKYYYLFYENQENVENAVIKPVTDLLFLLGKEYALNQEYTIAKEIVNPFGGPNLMKSGKMKIEKLPEYKHSLFATGSFVTDYDDNVAMQEDYYAFRHTEPDGIEEAPYIYIRDNFRYQYNISQQRVMSYTTTHTVYLNNNKQGLDKEWNLWYYKKG